MKFIAGFEKVANILSSVGSKVSKTIAEHPIKSIAGAALTGAGATGLLTTNNQKKKNVEHANSLYHKTLSGVSSSVL